MPNGFHTWIWGVCAIWDRVLAEPVPHGYNEPTFHHLLSIERARADRSDRPFLVLLVDFIQQDGARGRIKRRLACALFSTLRRCLRDTDFVGWYREGYIVGGVLTEVGAERLPEILGLVDQRVRETLREHLPSDVILHLKVCIYPHTGIESLDSGEMREIVR